MGHSKSVVPVGLTTSTCVRRILEDSRAREFVGDLHGEEEGTQGADENEERREWAKAVLGECGCSSTKRRMPLGQASPREGHVGGEMVVLRTRGKRKLPRGHDRANSVQCYTCRALR